MPSVLQKTILGRRTIQEANRPLVGSFMTLNPSRVGHGAQGGASAARALSWHVSYPLDSVAPLARQGGRDENASRRIDRRRRWSWQLWQQAKPGPRGLAGPAGQPGV